ncbi:hypothetical protein CHIBITOTORO_00200 [Serratia phage vB_SmaM-ChibiTotoro]|nr:hypothetical protein CHIBITOTORO_00200 [Serratia phage vB_SmaM-ChibiTotoro]
MTHRTPWQHDLNAAIDEARRRRVLRGQHFAVVQTSGCRVGVRIYRPDMRAAWSTIDDSRSEPWPKPRSKLEPSDVALIRALRKDGLTLRCIAAKFDVSIATIDRAARGVSWAGAENNG